MLPKLNLDGTLNKRPSNVQTRLTEEGQPGMYSPRIASNQPPKGVTVPPTIGGPAPSRSSSSSASSCKPIVPGHAASLSPPHLSTHDMSLIEDGVVGISDPEMTAILAAKARHGPGDRSPPVDRLVGIGMGPGGGGGGGGSSPPGNRRAAPLATLVDHQQARQAAPHPSTDAVSGAAETAATRGKGATAGVGDAATAAPRVASASPATATNRGSSLAASSHASSMVPRQGAAGAPSLTTSSTAVSVLSAEEVYVSGKPFREYMSLCSARPSLTDAPATPTTPGVSGAPVATAAASSGTHITSTFHQNPSQYISSLASQGDMVAVGDRTGRVVVMRQREMATGPRRTLLDVIQRSGEAEECAEATTISSPFSPSRHVGALHRVRDPYELYVTQQAYVPVIDTLNNVEVSPTVTALAFLPQCGPTTYLLAANEKVPKLYKIMSVRDSPHPFRAVDKMSTKTIGPLTAGSRTSTVAMRPVSRYAMSHECNIHSICPVAHSDQFATADDAAVRLWCTEYPDTSIETYQLRSPYDEGPQESIRAVRNFPHEPFLFFIATSAGSVRLVDTRQTLRWTDQAAQAFVNPPREEDEPFSNVTNSICDCALSPSGRYIAGRDFMSVCLWDIRMAGGGTRNAPASPRRQTSTTRSSDTNVECSMVRRWALHPHLRDDLHIIYQSNLLFDRFDVQFLSSRQVCTGGFNNTLYTMDVESTSTDTASDIRTFQLPKTEGVSEFRRTTVSAYAPGEDRVRTGQGQGSRLTLMSRPCMSMSGTCGFMVACGQAVLQLSYNGLSK